MNQADTKKLKAFADRVEHLLADQDALRDDLKELKIEIRAARLDPKALTLAVKYRRSEESKRARADTTFELFDAYRHALGLTPLEAAAE